MEDMDKKDPSVHGEVRFPHFPKEEFQKRLQRAKELMGEWGMDALLLFASEDLYYYTGLKKENLVVEKGCRRGAVLPKDGEPILLVANDVFLNAVTSSWVRDIRWWGGKPGFGEPRNFMEGFVETIKELDLYNKTLGVELWDKMPVIQVDLTWREFDILKKGLPEAKFVDAGELIWEQRMIKTPYEIGIIRELSSIVTEGYTAGLEAVREGISERQVINTIYETMLSQGLMWNQPYFARIPVRGPGHYHAGIMGAQDTVLKKGDMLMFDGGPIHQGYHIDVQRNACIGEPPVLQRKLYDAALEGLDAALAIIRPGIRAGDVHRTALDRLKSLDPKLNIIRNVFAGHGLGLYTHEPPYLDPAGSQADIILKEGMYLAVEISAFDSPEFRVIGGFPEDSILVIKDGHENLTKNIPRQLWIA